MFFLFIDINIFQYQLEIFLLTNFLLKTSSINILFKAFLKTAFFQALIGIFIENLL